MIRTIVLVLLSTSLPGCKIYELNACAAMCRPGLALKYEDGSCYCLHPAQPPSTFPPDAGR